MVLVLDATKIVLRDPMISLCLLALSIAISYLTLKWIVPRPLPGIPHDDEAARLLGDLPNILAYRREHGRLRPWFVAQTRKLKAPLVQFRLMPWQQPALILSDYQEIQDILLRRTKEFDRAQRSADVFHGVVPNHHIAMTSSDPRFKGNKELVRDLMAPGFLNEVTAPEIYAKTMALIDLWTLKADLAQGKPFNAIQDIFDATLDMINAAAFAFDDSMSIMKGQVDLFRSLGGPRGTEDSDGSMGFPRPVYNSDIASMNIVTEHLGTQLSSLKPRIDHQMRMLMQPRLRQGIKRKNALIAREIERSLARLQSGDKTMHSALDHLLLREMNAAQRTERNPDFHSKRISDELFGYVIGGHETSSTALAWITKFIADHPRVQDRLRSALRSAYTAAASDSRQPTAAEITRTSVPYLDAVIEESLRCAAPLPLFVRQTTVDTVVLGRHVPRGTTMFMPVDGPTLMSPGYPIDDCLRSESSREKHWGGRWDERDIHLFRPERWLRTGSDGVELFDPQAGPILAFALGPRGCFGKRLAYLEMRMGLALLIWNFEFGKFGEPLSSHEAYDKITTMPKYCYVSLKKLP